MQRFGIGSSDACLVHGLTAFGRTQFDLFAELQRGGAEVSEDREEPEFRMQLGNELEHHIIRKLGVMLGDEFPGVLLTRGPTLFEEPFRSGILFSRPDAYAVFKDQILVAEAKVITVYGRAVTVGNNEIPENYFYQGLHHVAVARHKWPGKKVRLFYGFYDLVNFESKFLEFLYTEEQLENHISTCLRWWADHVEAGSSPPITGDNSGKLAAAVFDKEGSERAAIPDEQALLARLRGFKELQSKVEQQVGAAEGELRALLLERGVDKVWDSGIGSYSYKLQDGRASIDTARLEASYPGVLEKFKKRGEPFRAARFTPAKAKKGE